jgi:hypothetical protein
VANFSYDFYIIFLSYFAVFGYFVVWNLDGFARLEEKLGELGKGTEPEYNGDGMGMGYVAGSRE